MPDWSLRIPWDKDRGQEIESLLTGEWLVTNGLGGYASGTLLGAATRRYHGLLIASLPAPLGRQVMFNHLAETVRLPDGSVAQLGGEERPGGLLHSHGADHLTEFRLEKGLPIWRYRIGKFTLEKRVLMPHLQNTVHVHYRLLEGHGTIAIEFQPSFRFRPHEAPVNGGFAGPYSLRLVEQRYEVVAHEKLPCLRMYLHGEGSVFTLQERHLPDILYRVEEGRGYEAVGDLWSPGYFRLEMRRGDEATLIASTESWETVLALPPQQAAQAEHERRERLIARAAPEVRQGPASELVLAADQFLIIPVGRVEDVTRLHAMGEEVRSVIAGYHWFTDWGRDTMISLEGLTLTTGRQAEASYLLRTFAQYVRDGLLPNLFPEGGKEGLYHTADATLWFFHAIDRYLSCTNDTETLRFLLPTLRDIVAHHLQGTHFGIGVDEKDGLLRQGAAGYQLTWMDAKVGDWVVTPRRGKAVEINALWYNALRLLEGWLSQEEGESAALPLAKHAERARRSFNERFWFEAGGYLYDVVDGEQGNDTACRPNQIFALSLRHPVLDAVRWRSVLDVVTRHLLTPFGLRSLAPGHPDYKAKYYGDLRARDAAYHQGTVWAWLIGPYLDAWRRVHPDRAQEARRFLTGFVRHLSEACIGSISEIFDAEEPYIPRGCIAQAWSVAEVLRCWAVTNST